ncbi:beta-amyrin 28-monooxygenase-like isoform X2 [Hevea brasiliensis]|uniref:beta-amyrin 28-monooxygenase-like isoform X2 n=1 Tax=Hevea brasiliensis TaxID=3981 RepID=UPI0025CCAAF1|nr:beta-amyrin 28-monooxygenase-like isoform X2 [Hevea brasiliensis]
MEVFFPYLLHLAVFFISLSLIFLLYKQKPSDSHGNKHPPGTKGWPFVGESLEYVKVGRRGQPEKFVNDRVSKYSPDVFQTSLLGEKIAVFCGASGNKLLFTSENKYVTAWWPRSMLKALLFQDSLQISAKEESVRIRRLLPEFLKPEALQHHIPVMDSMAREHLKTDWYPYKEVKVFPLTKKYTFALACRLFMSIKDPNQVTKYSNPFALVTSGMLSVPINFPGTAYNKAIKGSKFILNELLVIIQQRKMELLEKKDTAYADLLTRMLLEKDENGSSSMSHTEIANRIMALLIASHDTISTTLTFALKYLVQYPHVYTKVLKEQMEIAKSKAPDELLNWDDIQKMKYSWCVACETMRLSPPSQGAFREAITDFTYAGFTIPKGWKTHWTVHSTHKNPKYFPNPEKFDPSRFEGEGPAPYTYVPFGGGPLMCPGKEYARLEILIFMHNVVTKFKWKQVNEDEKIIFDPTPIPVNGMKNLNC